MVRRWLVWFDLDGFVETFSKHNLRLLCRLMKNIVGQKLTFVKQADVLFGICSPFKPVGCQACRDTFVRISPSSLQVRRGHFNFGLTFYHFHLTPFPFPRKISPQIEH